MGGYVYARDPNISVQAQWRESDYEVPLFSVENKDDNRQGANVLLKYEQIISSTLNAIP